MARILAIVGPTAVGKTEVGLTLAAAFAGEIISADALQVYRGLDVGTAKPAAADRRRIRHHLIDILEPHQPFSAGEFARRALRAVGEIESRQRLPLVVGGSGLYIRALIGGISPIPEVDPEVRARLRDRLGREGLAELRRELEERDAATAERLHRGDTQRTLRALEVVLATGRPLSRWLAAQPPAATAIDAVTVGLTLPRALLYDRIASRVRSMLQAGWVEEVRDLLERGLSPDVPAFQAIGYRQLAAHVRGEMTLEEALTDTIRATRRYAKRQLTWFRRESGVQWFSAEDLRQCCQQVSALVNELGLGGNHGQG